MQKLKGGQSEAEFPPQICGLGLQPKIRVARGAAQINVNYLRGGGEGCCPADYIIHPPCPRLVGRLLQSVLGDGEGLVLREGVSSRIRGHSRWVHRFHEAVRFVRIAREFAPLSTISLSHISHQRLCLLLFVTMSQHTLSQLASLLSRERIWVGEFHL